MRKMILCDGFKLGSYVSHNGTKVEKFVDKCCDVYGYRKVVTLPENSSLRKAGIDRFEYFKSDEGNSLMVKDAKGNILASNANFPWAQENNVAKFIAKIKRRMS